MQKRPFGNTGFSVSPLGFGGAPIGLLQTEREAAGNLLNLLLDEGVNVIDTAARYKDSEEVIGQYVGHRRNEFVVVSKCGPSVPHVEAPEWSAEMIEQTIDASLGRLRTDHLDVMLLHSCEKDVLERGEAVAALARARDAGKIRFAGYSGDNEAAAFAAALSDIAVIETSISIADQSNIDTVIPTCRQRNLGVLAKRPIANAAWKQPDDQPGFYKEYASTYTDRLRQMNLKPADLGFTAPPEQAWPELALRFALSIPGVHTTIIGTTKVENARTNVAIANNGPLPPAVVEHVRAAFKKADPTGAWIGQT
ncbi:MAG TPA: aldo/keto reductase [Tepidisphaeraceae bacterium]|nr:aldo/keto reductase [Tepidisphaeraceae bacterium]